MEVEYLEAQEDVCINGMNYTGGKIYKIMGENEFDYEVKCDEGVGCLLNKSNGDLSTFKQIKVEQNQNIKK